MTISLIFWNGLNFFISAANGYHLQDNPQSNCLQAVEGEKYSFAYVRLIIFYSVNQKCRTNSHKQTWNLIGQKCLFNLPLNNDTFENKIHFSCYDLATSITTQSENYGCILVHHIVHVLAFLLLSSFHFLSKILSKKKQK